MNVSISSACNIQCTEVEEWVDQSLDHMAHQQGRTTEGQTLLPSGRCMCSRSRLRARTDLEMSEP